MIIGDNQPGSHHAAPATERDCRKGNWCTVCHKNRRRAAAQVDLKIYWLSVKLILHLVADFNLPAVGLLAAWVTIPVLDINAPSERQQNMTYRVTFAKRFQADGNESHLDPTAELDVNLAEGIVLDKVFVQRLEPEARHNQEVLDEDDAFLGMAAAEVWEYQVEDGRDQEFLDAISNSQTVMEYQTIDDVNISTT